MKKMLFTMGLVMLIFLSEMTIGQERLSQINKLTFEQALLITKQNSLIMKQAKEHTQQKKLERQATKGLYLPQISINAAYTYMAEDIHLDLTPVRDAITPLYGALGNYGVFSGVPNPDPNTSAAMPFLPDNISTNVIREQLLEGLNTVNSAEWNQIIQKKQFGLVSAGFALPIYVGGKIRIANKAAEIKVEEAEAESVQKFHELSCEMIERYYGLVLSLNAQKIRKEVYITMQSHLDDAEKMMNEGMIARAEYLHAKVYSASADRELKKAIRQVDIINDALLNTLAINDEISISPISTLFYIKKIENVEYFQNQAMTHSPLLHKIEKKKELAQQAYNLEKAEFFPSIAAMGTYDLYNQDLSPYMPEYMFGVGLKWNVFGSKRLYKKQAAKIQQEQVNTFYQKAESDIKTAIKKYHQEINMNLEQLKELETALEFATEYYRVRDHAFKEGMATTTEVSDANLAVAKVKIERLQIMYAYDVALSKLLYYAGLAEEFSNYMLSPEAIYESY